MLPEAASYLARAETRDKNGMIVTVSALGAEDSRDVFGKSVAKHGIQPLWLKFDNETDDPVWYLPVATDPDYFSPLEVAYRFHGRVSADENRKIDALFVRHQIGSLILAHSAMSGFLFTNTDTGLKIAKVLLVGRSSPLQSTYSCSTGGKPSGWSGIGSSGPFPSFSSYKFAALATQEDVDKIRRKGGKGEVGPHL